MDKKNLMRTGVNGLDEMLNGGLIPQRTYIISGSPGSGKTTFAIQFLLQGIKDSEKVLFVAIDEPPNEIKFNYTRFDWNIDDLKILDANSDIRRLEPTPVLDITSKSMVRKVSEIPDVIRKTPDFESVIVTIHSLQQAVKQLIDKERYTRLVIDSMSGVKYFCMEGLDENISTQSFMRFLAETKVTTLLLVETGETIPLTPELFLARGEIRLHKWWSAGMLHRGISVELIRGSRHDETIRPMEITRSGMVVYPRINDWKRKTGKRPRKYSDDNMIQLRADISLLEKSLDEAPAQFGQVEVDLRDIHSALISAKAHLERGELIYTFEIVAYCTLLLENKMAVPNSIRKIVTIETSLAEYRSRQMKFPEVDEILKKAKDCVNRDKYADALQYASDCEMLLTEKLKELDHALREAEEKANKETTRKDTGTTITQPPLDMPKPSHAPDSEPVALLTSTEPIHKTEEPIYKEVEHKPVDKKTDETIPQTHAHKASVKSESSQKTLEAQITATQACIEADLQQAAALHEPRETQQQTPPPPPPTPPTPSPAKLCPYCLKELKFIQQYSRWYCYTCKKYAPKDY